MSQQQPPTFRRKAEVRLYAPFMNMNEVIRRLGDRDCLLFPFFEISLESSSWNFLAAAEVGKREITVTKKKKKQPTMCELGGFC